MFYVIESEWWQDDIEQFQVCTVFIVKFAFEILGQHTQIVRCFLGLLE